jgi:methylated-DNA-[protein]-cysteine S-methyltransferase
MRRPTATACFTSPLGPIIVHADDAHLLGLKITPNDANSAGTGDISHPILAQAVAQLSYWFSGARQEFDLPLVPLQQPEAARLRASIAAIPFGETRTYGAVANATGSIARAVGQACKTNAFPIIIPCHRVTSAAGPEYYSAGDGPRTKTWLLDYEYAQLPREKRTRLI